MRPHSPGLLRRSKQRLSIAEELTAGDGEDGEGGTSDPQSTASTVPQPRWSVNSATTDSVDGAETSEETEVLDAALERGPHPPPDDPVESESTAEVTFPISQGLQKKPVPAEHDNTRGSVVNAFTRSARSAVQQLNAVWQSRAAWMMQRRRQRVGVEEVEEPVEPQAVAEAGRS